MLLIMKPKYIKQETVSFDLVEKLFISLQNDWFTFSSTEQLNKSCTTNPQHRTSAKCPVKCKQESSPDHDATPKARQQIRRLTRDIWKLSLGKTTHRHKKIHLKVSMVTLKNKDWNFYKPINSMVTRRWAHELKYQSHDVTKPNHNFTKPDHITLLNLIK